jgi:hypothetical protein
MARSLLDKRDVVAEGVDFDNIDNRLANLLVAVENENVPDRLLKLALELQNELALRRQRRNPN